MLPIPISSLIIDRTEDALILKGVGEDIDLSLYNTLLIPDDITEISDGAFYKKFSNFSNINNIIFNNNLKSIGKFAFADCTSLTCKINLPSGLTSLGEKAFFNCSNISSELIIPP